jgi:FixJ family two-component response regulator
MGRRAAFAKISKVGGSARRKKAPNIILVDDDFYFRQALRRLLRENGFDVISFERPSEVLLSRLPMADAVLILDIWMPEMTGVALWKELHKKGFTIPTILITGQQEERATLFGEEIGAVAVLFKPVEEKELLDAIARALVRPNG